MLCGTIMTPQVRYTKASDGVHIAFWEDGEGSPIVHMPSTPLTHVQLEWDVLPCRRWYERLMASGHALVRYDARGFGLSDRDVADYTLEAQMRDLDAVVDALKLEKFKLFAQSDTGMVAIAWAAAHPERVSHLILWCSWASRARVSGTSQTKALRALLEQDWVVYTETVANVLLGWSSDVVARQFAAFYRECASPEVLRVSVPALYEWDVTGLLSQVKCPTLVMQRRELPTLPVDVARELARGIPDSRLVLLDGRSPLPFMEDTTAVLSTISEFLGDDDSGAAGVAEAAGQASVTILFTDMEGSTPLTQRLGDAAAQEIVRTHNRIVREAVGAHGGTEIKHTGDGLMVSFPSATRGVECAVAIQRALAAYSDEHSDSALRVRVGLNAGEPVAERGDYFGTAVQLAARICQLAEPGQILVSGVVRDLTAGKRFLFADLGETAPRGFEDTVHLYEVRWRA
jgi:class 3 adenylate cyclase